MVERLKDLGTPEDNRGYAEFIQAADELSKAEDEAQLASERGDTRRPEAAESKPPRRCLVPERGRNRLRRLQRRPERAGPRPGAEAGEAEAGEEAEAVEPKFEPEVEEEAVARSRARNRRRRRHG